MSSWMKTGGTMLLLFLIVCGVATTRMNMMHVANQELHLNLMKKISIEDGTVENSTPTYPGTSADNHHKIPRTQFNGYGPPGADDGGDEGGDNK